MATQIQFKRGIAASLQIVNPVLAAGEPCYETDTKKFKIGDGTTAWNSLAYHEDFDALDVTNNVTIGGDLSVTGSVTVDGDPVSTVPDAPSDGGTYAREDGQWVDVAQAANLQLRRGTEAERVQITPLEGEPIYTTDSKKLYIGDGSTAGGNEIVSGKKAPRQNPPGMARMVTVRNSSTFSITVKSTTGYVAARWWDGSVEVFGAGVAANNITVSKAIPTTGNWIKSAPKEIFIWSCTVGNANQSGNLTTLNCGNGNSLTSLDVSGLTALAQLFCSTNSLTSLDVSGLTSLNLLACNANSLTSLDVSGLTALTTLNCSTNSLTSLDVSGLTALNGLSCNNNSLTSLNVSGLTALTTLVCSNNPLTSLRAVGVVFDSGKWKNKKKGKAYGIQRIDNNLLNAAALNQFYTDLGATTPGTGFLDVKDNPGSATADHTIATNKGYVVFA
jgi:hypothetical protein